MRRKIVKGTASTRASRRKPPSGNLENEGSVSADEVIADLLSLFTRLGIDAPNVIGGRVRRKRSKAISVSPQSFSPATVGELLAAWYENPNYLDAHGNPRPVKFYGPRESFYKLAQDSLPNISASLVLAELKRLGAVSVDRSNIITARMRSVPIYEDKRLAAQHTLSSLASFIRTLSHNLESAPSNSDQLFHRIACSSDFDIKHIQALKIRLKRHGQNFLESFDNWLVQKTLPKPRGRRKNFDRAQVSIGVYLSVT